MLQIISGKFFKSDDLSIQDAKGILYSNYSWVMPIETCIGTLEPVDTYWSSVSSYVFSYKSKMEKDASMGAGDTEIIRQFQLISTFGLRGFFDIDRYTIELNCRKDSRDLLDAYVPSRFVSRFFDSRIDGQIGEIEDFKKFINKVIGLPRYKYISVINSLSAFYYSLEMLNHDIDLAYSLLIYSIESLSQNFDDYVPNWNDYDQPIKEELEECFCRNAFNEESSNEIRSILLKSSNLRLNKRFIDFASKYVRDGFFCNEAVGIKGALKRSELPLALKNAYNMRSGYVHQLKPIQGHLKVPGLADGDVFHWENKPYLTFRGLVRLSYHIIDNFIYCQEYIEKEDYDWRSDIPGIINMKVAPIYWIWNLDGFDKSQVFKRFEGLLKNVVAIISTPGPIADLRNLLRKYESLLPTVEETYKIPMIATYYLYNALVNDEGKVPNYLELLNLYEYLLNRCSIEMMAIRLLTNQEEFPWDIKECVSCYKAYTEKKFAKNAFLFLP